MNSRFVVRCKHTFLLSLLIPNKTFVDYYGFIQHLSTLGTREWLDFVQLAFRGADHHSSPIEPGLLGRSEWSDWPAIDNWISWDSLNSTWIMAPHSRPISCKFYWSLNLFVPISRRVPALCAFHQTRLYVVCRVLVPNADTYMDRMSSARPSLSLLMSPLDLRNPCLLWWRFLYQFREYLRVIERWNHRREEALQSPNDQQHCHQWVER